MAGIKVYDNISGDTKHTQKYSPGRVLQQGHKLPFKLTSKLKNGALLSRQQCYQCFAAH